MAVSAREIASGFPLERRSPVKLIIAIIQPGKLERVKQALSEVEVFRLTVLDVQGFGRQRGHAEAYRGHEISVNLVRKVQLQIAVNDEFVEPTIEAIIRGGRSGEHGEIDLSSLGKDGQPGGTGEAADINNW